jgi:hypothetical protein
MKKKTKQTNKQKKNQQIFAFKHFERQIDQLITKQLHNINALLIYTSSLYICYYMKFSTSFSVF